MTAASDNTQDSIDAKEPDQSGAARRVLVQTVLRGIGGVMVLAALGLWFAPGASWESEVILFKLILSVASGVTGLGMIQSSMGPRDAMVEIDPTRAEIRLLCSDCSETPGEPATYSFKDLGHARLDGTRVSFWSKSDLLLAEVTMSNRRALANVVGALKDAGKLA